MSLVFCDFAEDGELVGLLESAQSVGQRPRLGSDCNQGSVGLESFDRTIFNIFPPLDKD